MWRKINRALDKGRMIDAYIGNYNHMTHRGHAMKSTNNQTGSAPDTIIRREFDG